MNQSKEYNLLKTLGTQTKTGTLSHAYLVFGDVDTDLLVKTLKIEIPDTFLINEKPIKISHIREFIHWLNFKPHSSSLRLAVLQNIEEMTIEAANSLLKVLEEAPSYAILILQAFKKERILPTIISRCQIIREIQNLDEGVPKSYLSHGKISKMSIKERFDYANILAEDENLLKIINLWEKDYRQRLLMGEDMREILSEILKTRSLLSTNTSVKLLLENLILKF